MFTPKTQRAHLIFYILKALSRAKRNSKSSLLVFLSISHSTHKQSIGLQGGANFKDWPAKYSSLPSERISVFKLVWKWNMFVLLLLRTLWPKLYLDFAKRWQNYKIWIVFRDFCKNIFDLWFFAKESDNQLWKHVNDEHKEQGFTKITWSLPYSTGTVLVLY